MRERERVVGNGMSRSRGSGIASQWAYYGGRSGASWRRACVIGVLLMEGNSGRGVSCVELGR